MIEISEVSCMEIDVDFFVICSIVRLRECVLIVFGEIIYFEFVEICLYVIKNFLLNCGIGQFLFSFLRCRSVDFFFEDVIGLGFEFFRGEFEREIQICVKRIVEIMG